MDLLVETGPERFVAIECKITEQVTPDSLKAIRRLAKGVPIALGSKGTRRLSYGNGLPARKDERR